jgi:hypothetical protein
MPQADKPRRKPKTTNRRPKPAGDVPKPPSMASVAKPRPPKSPVHHDTLAGTGMEQEPTA